MPSNTESVCGVVGLIPQSQAQAVSLRVSALRYVEMGGRMGES